MKLVDLNLLLYAVNQDSAHHVEAKAWLERVLSGEEPVGLPWVVVLGFLRISTSPRVFPKPLEPTQALAVVDDWLSVPVVETVGPGGAHWRLLNEMINEAGTAGNLTTDAHLAALAIEHGAQLNSTDSDFGRFRYLRWTNPLRPTYREPGGLQSGR